MARHISIIFKPCAALVVVAILFASAVMAGCASAPGEPSAAEAPTSNPEETKADDPPTWAEDEAELDELTQQNLTSLIVAAMSRAQFLVDNAYDEALEAGRPDDPDLLARQTEFGKMAKLLARVASTDEGDTEALEKEYRELRSIMGLEAQG